MGYKEFVNFSGYDFDILKFNNDWEIFRSFLASHSLDGAEMLLDFKPLSESIPRDLVSAVHFPSFMGWYRFWKDSNSNSCGGLPNFIDKDSVKYFYGGESKEDVISNFTACIRSAESYPVAYGVFHAGYMEIEHTFRKDKYVSDIDVIRACADLLNQIAAEFLNSEMPYPIAIENLWWSGLTFLDPNVALEFTKLLEFDNWFFLLDTGHLMSASYRSHNESEGIRIVLDTLNAQHDDVLDKIKAMHFHFSASANYQESMHEPSGFLSMNYSDINSAVISHLSKFDEHRAFTLEGCRDIVDFVNPDYLTHEFSALSRSSLDLKLSTQIRALKKSN